MTFVTLTVCLMNGVELVRVGWNSRIGAPRPLRLDLSSMRKAVLGLGGGRRSLLHVGEKHILSLARQVTALHASPLIGQCDCGRNHSGTSGSEIR